MLNGAAQTRMPASAETVEPLMVGEFTPRPLGAAGKFRARRHAVKDCRFYRREDVERLKREIEHRWP
jgi:hypothetical protein